MRQLIRRFPVFAALLAAITLAVSPAVAGTIITFGGASARGLGFAATQYDPAAQALFARMSTPPTDARKTLINTMIVSLKATGVWAKLDALYVTAAADSQAASLNWVSTSFNITVVGSPTFTADRGYNSTDAVPGTSYLNTTYNPSTAGGLYTQNSAHFSVWSRTTAVNIYGAGGNYVAPNGTHIFPRYTGDALLWRMNGPLETGTNTDGSGLFTVTRTASTTTEVYRNGVSLQTGSTTSAAPVNLTLSLCGDNEVSPTSSAIQVAGASIGSGLTDQNALDLYNAMQAYMTAVGA